MTSREQIDKLSIFELADYLIRKAEAGSPINTTFRSLEAELTYVRKELDRKLNNASPKEISRFLTKYDNHPMFKRELRKAWHIENVYNQPLLSQASKKNKTGSPAELEQLLQEPAAELEPSSNKETVEQSLASAPFSTPKKLIKGYINAENTFFDDSEEQKDGLYDKNGKINESPQNQNLHELLANAAAAGVSVAAPGAVIPNSRVVQKVDKVISDVSKYQNDTLASLNKELDFAEFISAKVNTELENIPESQQAGTNIAVMTPTQSRLSQALSTVRSKISSAVNSINRFNTNLVNSVTGYFNPNLSPPTFLSPINLSSVYSPLPYEEKDENSEGGVFPADMSSIASNVDYSVAESKDSSPPISRASSVRSGGTLRSSGSSISSPWFGSSGYYPSSSSTNSSYSSSIPSSQSFGSSIYAVSSNLSPDSSFGDSISDYSSSYDSTVSSVPPLPPPVAPPADYIVPPPVAATPSPEVTYAQKQSLQLQAVFNYMLKELYNIESKLQFSLNNVNKYIEDQKDSMKKFLAMSQIAPPDMLDAETQSLNRIESEETTTQRLAFQKVGLIPTSYISPIGNIAVARNPETIYKKPEPEPATMFTITDPKRIDLAVQGLQKLFKTKRSREETLEKGFITRLREEVDNSVSKVDKVTAKGRKLGEGKRVPQAAYIHAQPYTEPKDFPESMLDCIFH